MASPEKYPRFCVLGAGHGGMAMAGHLALMGVPVTIYNRSEPRIEPIKLTGGSNYSARWRGSAGSKRLPPIRPKSSKRPTS